MALNKAQGREEIYDRGDQRDAIEELPQQEDTTWQETLLTHRINVTASSITILGSYIIPSVSVRGFWV